MNHFEQMFNILPGSHFYVPLHIFKAHESNYTLESVMKVCKQKIDMLNYLKNSLKRRL